MLCARVTGGYLVTHKSRNFGIETRKLMGTTPKWKKLQNKINRGNWAQIWPYLLVRPTHSLPCWLLLSKKFPKTGGIINQLRPCSLQKIDFILTKYLSLHELIAWTVTHEYFECPGCFVWLMILRVTNTLHRTALVLMLSSIGVVVLLLRGCYLSSALFIIYLHNYYHKFSLPLNTMSIIGRSLGVTWNASKLTYYTYILVLLFL